MLCQASEVPCREPTSGGNGGSGPQVIPGSGLGLEDDIVPRELAHSLQQIWNPRGCHNESVSVVSELFAVCRHDLYILLTFEGTLKDAVKDQTASEATGSKGIIGVKRKQDLHTESRKALEGVGSRLHDALAKVHLAFLIGLYFYSEIGPSLIILVFLIQLRAGCFWTLLNLKTYAFLLIFRES